MAYSGDQYVLVSVYQLKAKKMQHNPTFPLYNSTNGLISAMVKPINDYPVQIKQCIAI